MYSLLGLMFKAPRWFVVVEVLLGLGTIALEAVAFVQARRTVSKLDDRCDLDADGEFLVPAVREWKDVITSIEPLLLLALCLSSIFSFVFALKAAMSSLNMCLENSFGRFMQCLMLLLPHLVLALAVGGLNYASFSFLRSQVDPAVDADCFEVDTDMLARTAWIGVLVSTAYVLTYLGYDMSCHSAPAPSPHDDMHEMRSPMMKPHCHAEEMSPPMVTVHHAPMDSYNHARCRTPAVPRHPC